MGSSPSTTNDCKGPVQVNVRHNRQDTNVKPTRHKSPLHRASSSLSISSKASFSPFSVLPPVTSRYEISDGRATPGSKKRKTSRQTQCDEEGSVYLPDTRKPLPDIRNTIMSNAGSSGMMKTIHHRSNNHGRPSLQPLDSIQLMRENGPRRHRRNRNGVDFTQSGYNKSDLEIAVQASLAISEEQQSHGEEDNVYEHKVSKLKIQTSEISESFSDEEEVGRGIMSEEWERKDPSDFLDEEETVDMNEEEQEEADNENDEEGVEDFDPNIRNEDLSQSGYDKRDLDIAVQMSLAISEELFSDQEEVGRGIMNEERESHEEGTVDMSEEEQKEEEDENDEDGVETFDPDIRNVDLSQSGYDKRDLDIAVQMSLAISEELFSDQEEVGRGIMNEERERKDPSDFLDEEETVDMSEEVQKEADDKDNEEGVEDLDPGISFSDQEEVGRGIMNEERERKDPSDFLDEEETVDMSEEVQKEADDKDNEEGVEDLDPGISFSDQEEVGRGIMNEERERKDPSDFLDEEESVDMSEEEHNEADDENNEEGVEDLDPDIRPIDDILSEMRDTINDSGYINLCIKRSCVWGSALEQFRQENFSPADGFGVNFVDDDGNEEGAIDAGGPKREYFQLIMDHLANCSLFEGPPGRKLLSYDVQANRRNEYFYAGMVIGQSLLYGGPVPRFLSPLLLECLILEPENVTGSLGDIYDSDWLQLLDEVQKTDCVRDFVLTHNKTLHLAGCLRNEKMDNKDQLIQDLINYYLVERTRPAFDKFKQGLDSVGVYQFIRRYPNQFRELFSRQEPLTAEIMSAIFTICYSYISSEVEDNSFDEGESREDNDHDMMTEVEKKTAEYWKTYLGIVEAGDSQINLENILMFTTGMKERPYGQSPMIYFNHSYYGQPASKYPRSSTCSCALYLPLHDTFEEFKEAMDFGILNGSQFGNA